MLAVRRYNPSYFEDKVTMGKIRGLSRGKTHDIHLAQEDHCSQLSVVHCWR
jgi:hypothetical protein